MTEQERFANYMRRARSTAMKSLYKYDQEVGRLYIDLAGQVTEELKSAHGLTEVHLKSVRSQLLKAANETTRGFKTTLDKALLEAGDIQVKAVDGGMSPYWDKLYRTGLNPQAMLYKLPDEAVKLVYARVHENGLMLSKSIWRLNQNTRQGLSRLVTEGVARGFHYDDPRIVEQVERFLQPAKLNAKTMRAKRLQRVITRKLKDGTTYTFRQRSVSYDAARLLRTEFGNAFKEASHLAAERNPACEGEQWILSAFHPDIGCDCENYAQHDEGLGEGVYSVGNFPITPHPQCLCTSQSVVMSMRDFMPLIEEYMKGKPGVISRWADKFEMEMAA